MELLKILVSLLSSILAVVTFHVCSLVIVLILVASDITLAFILAKIPISSF